MMMPQNQRKLKSTTSSSTTSSAGAGTSKMKPPDDGHGQNGHDCTDDPDDSSNIRKPCAICISATANENAMASKPKQDISIEGGVPIISSVPTNVNIRSFYISNPFATFRSKGPRSGGGGRDPKWNPRGTQKPHRTANKVIVENGICSSETDCRKSKTEGNDPNETVAYDDKFPPLPESSHNHGDQDQNHQNNGPRRNDVRASSSKSADDTESKPVKHFSTQTSRSPRIETEGAEGDTTVILRNPIAGFKLVTYSDSDTSDVEEEILISPVKIPDPVAASKAVPRKPVIREVDHSAQVTKPKIATHPPEPVLVPKRDPPEKVVLKPYEEAKQKRPSLPAVPVSVPKPKSNPPKEEVPNPPEKVKPRMPPPLPPSALPSFEDLLLVVEKCKNKLKPKPKIKPAPTCKTKLSSVAEEFKKLVQELAAEDLQEKNGKNKIPMYEYFDSIYGLAFINTPPPPPPASHSSDSDDDEDTKSITRFSVPRIPESTLGPLHVYADAEDFALPDERPPSPKFDRFNRTEGITVTVAAVESFEQFVVFDHAGSTRLMQLETEMTTFYGSYLMRKREEYRELFFGITKGGYYAVFMERWNIWTRCYITSMEPPRSEFVNKGEEVYDPEQLIRAILFDYDLTIHTFTRKQFLPLKRFFLHLAIQKIDAQISWHKDAAFPQDMGDINQFRQLALGQQFHARITNYMPETEPMPTAWLELDDPIYDD